MAEDLRALQQWMLAAVTGHVPPDADTVVQGGAGLSAQARLGIYARGYWARLLGHLRAEFPMLRELVGDDVFDLFAMAYLTDRPPTSPSLFDLGAGFPAYLDDTRPRGDAAALPAAVARLDQLKTR